MQKYSVASDVDPTLLRDVEPGAEYAYNIRSRTKEYIVKGIMIVKNQDIGQRVFFV